MSAPKENGPNEPCTMHDDQEGHTFPNAESSYRKWKNCANSVMQPKLGDAKLLWDSIADITNECGESLLSELKTATLTNQDEIKFHVLPLDAKENTTFVTLGIGHDIDAEKQLQKIMGEGKIEFHGADPIIDQNQELFTTIGKYYPFAVGATTGISQAKVLEGPTITNYLFKHVIHLNALYFFKHFVQKTIHGLPTKEEQQLAHDFFFRILEDEQYVVVKVQNIVHLRVFMVNFDDERCVEKYISK